VKKIIALAVIAGFLGLASLGCSETGKGPGTKTGATQSSTGSKTETKKTE
jgi:hypothetical protein